MVKKILIIGGVAGGATAAARARRVDEFAEITVLEKSGYVSFANCGMPYWIGGEIPERKSLLLQTPEGFWKQYRIKVLIHTEALAINRTSKEVLVKTQSGEEKISYDTLILAQGAAPLQLPHLLNDGVSTERVFTLRSIEDMDRIDDFLKIIKPKTAVIAGGGFIGLEMAEALAHRGLQVSVVEKAGQVLPLLDLEFAERVRETLSESGVNVITGVGLKEITQASVILEDGKTLEADLILLSIGVRPELLLAKNCGLEIGTTGGVKVSASLRTSDPNIFAIGDMIETIDLVSGKAARVALAGPANRQARIAGSNAAGMSENYPGVMATSVIKIFDHTISSTGLTLKAALASGLNAAMARVHVKQHALYYPGAQSLHIGLVYEKNTLRLLGAQAFGKDGVEKRIDVVSALIKGRLTVRDLSQLDLAYSPPYNSANDPLNVAAMIAINSEDHFSPSIDPSEIRDEDLVLDVRNPDEEVRGAWPGHKLIPFPELRSRLEELPKNRRLAVHCQVGRRAHLAVRILKQHGFDAVNISGGWETIRYFQKTLPKDKS